METSYQKAFLIYSFWRFMVSKGLSEQVGDGRLDGGGGGGGVSK